MTRTVSHVEKGALEVEYRDAWLEKWYLDHPEQTYQARLLAVVEAEYEVAFTTYIAETPSAVNRVDRKIKPTVAGGIVTWAFDTPFPIKPVVQAIPVDPTPGDNISYNASIDSVSTTQVVVKVWKTQPLLALLGLPTVAAAAGVDVHLVAFAQ